MSQRTILLGNRLDKPYLSCIVGRGHFLNTEKEYTLPKIARTKTTNPVEIPFEKGTKHYAISRKLLSGKSISWTDLREEMAPLSPRTMGVVLRDLEAAGARFVRTRSSDEGTVYRVDKSGTAPTISTEPSTYNRNGASKAPVRASKAVKVSKRAPVPDEDEDEYVEPRVNRGSNGAVRRVGRPPKAVKAAKVAKRKPGRPRKNA